MCRSIKVLRKPGEDATAEEIAAAALQFVRKVSGQRKPSKAAEEAFLGAVEEISSATRKLLTSMPARRAAKMPLPDGCQDRAEQQFLPPQSGARGGAGNVVVEGNGVRDKSE